MAGQGGVNILLFTGPLFIGCMLSYFLSGCSLVQTIYFFQTTPILKRHRYIITLVSLVSIAELLNVIIVTVCLFHIFCVAIPNGDLSFQTPPIALASVTLNSLVAVSVQGHFALRIRKLSQGSWAGRVVPILIALMGLIQLASSIGMSYLIASANRELESITQQTRLVVAWFINTALADITITLSFVYIYLTFRKNTESRHSKNWLNSLILHSAENGAITSVGAIIHFAFYMAYPDTLIHIGVAYVVCRLYSNVLLASVNANRRFQQDGLSRSETSFSISGPPDASVRGIGAGGRSRDGSNTSGRRHSVSGALQRSALIGTRTESIEFTTINSSVPSRSGEERSEEQYGDDWKDGTHTKEQVPTN